MHFLLDQDVTALLSVALKQAGHECETASSVGMADASDDALVIAADNRDWIFITHDRELARKLSRQPIGRVVHLRCSEPSAPEVVARHLADLVNILSRDQDVMIEVKPESVTIKRGWKRWTIGDGH